MTFIMDVEIGDVEIGDVENNFQENKATFTQDNVIPLFAFQRGESWLRETERLYDAIVPACREPQRYKPTAIPEHIYNKDLSLEISEAPDYEPRRAALNPNTDTICKQISMLSWKPVTFVMLRFNNHYWMEISGNHAGGFSALCCINGREYVTYTAPGSIEVLSELLQSFAARSDVWRTLYAWCD